MTTNLNPGLLAALLGVSPTGNSNGQVQEYTDPATGRTYSLARNFEEVGGDAAYRTGNLLPGEIVTATGQKNNLGYNLLDVYDQQGNFVRQDDDGAGFGAFGDFVGDNMGAILAAIATAGVASAAGGAMGATAEAGAGGWADWAASELAGAASNPATAAQLNAWAAGSALPYAGSAAAGGAMGGGGSAGGGLTGGGGSEAAFNPNGITDPNFGANASFGGTTDVGGLGGSISAGGGSGGGGWMSNLAQLGGALAGAYGSRDQTQTQSRDPWGPAQPFLQSLLGQAQQLQQQYAQQPFSPLQQQAYRNQFGLLNAANQAAPGLLSGMQANAGGQNAYDRTNPRKSLVGSNPQFQWAPSLLNAFGG